MGCDSLEEAYIRSVENDKFKTASLYKMFIEFAKEFKCIGVRSLQSVFFGNFSTKGRRNSRIMSFSDKTSEEFLCLFHEDILVIMPLT